MIIWVNDDTDEDPIIDSPNELRHEQKDDEQEEQS